MGINPLPPGEACPGPGVWGRSLAQSAHFTGPSWRLGCVWLPWPGQCHCRPPGRAVPAAQELSPSVLGRHEATWSHQTLDRRLVVPVEGLGPPAWACSSKCQWPGKSLICSFLLPPSHLKTRSAWPWAVLLTQPSRRRPSRMCGRLLEGPLGHPLSPRGRSVPFSHPTWLC